MKKKFNYQLVFYGMLGMLLTAILVISCQKNTLTDLELIQEKDPTFTEAQYKRYATSYDANDLLELLGQYGTITPNILPAFNNYYQDISGGGSYLGQLSKVNDEVFITNSNVLLNDTVGYIFDWYINNDFQCSEANPKLWDLDENLLCDGVVELRLDITTPQGAKYSRTQWAYIDYNYIENCDCINCPLLFEVFYDFYPDIPDYFYQTQYATWDLNQDNCINTQDILILINGYGL